MGPSRRALFGATILCLVAALAGLGVVGWSALNRPATAQAGGVADIGGPFTLTTQTGAKLSDTDLRGKPFTVFFGFTNCPEVCPTTLFDMSEALKQLGPKADDLRVLFITVDPERDTPEFMARYLQSFDPRIVGLSGTRAEIDAVIKEFRVFSRKVPTEDGDYTMDHTASVFLMDAEGRFQGTIAYEEAASLRLLKLRRLVGEPLSDTAPAGGATGG